MRALVLLMATALTLTTSQLVRPGAAQAQRAQAPRARAAQGSLSKQLLAAALPQGDLPIRTGAFTFRAPGGATPEVKLDVKAVAEVVSDPAHATATPVTAVAAALGVFDNARPIAQWSAATKDLGRPSITTSFPVMPGTYRVRAVIQDDRKHVGAAETTVTAALTPAARGLSVSSMMLGTVVGGVFTPRLDVSSAAEITVYFELYGGKPGMPVAVIVELAESREGAAIAQARPTIVPTREPDKFIVTAPLNVAALPPGGYVVRATIGFDGEVPAMVYAEFRRPGSGVRGPGPAR